jgi:hypothetical protein
VFSLADVESAFRASFARDTCSEDDLPFWSPENPSRGHCAVTALTLHDLVGGDLLLAEVHRAGEKVGYHWWNRLAGIDIDLTRDQFAADEIVGEPEVVERPPGPLKRYADQYVTFRTRVRGALARGHDGARPDAVVAEDPPSGIDPSPR